MKKNNKGFTLIELLVAITIMAIITVIAIPQLSNLQNANQTKKYETYADSLIAGAKLYTDSYSDDMFGYNKTGCYKITYGQLKTKQLVKDIKIDGVDCGYDNEKTFVKVLKDNDNYTYQVSISCIDRDNKEIYSSIIDETCT